MSQMSTAQDSPIVAPPAIQSNQDNEPEAVAETTLDAESPTDKSQDGDSSATSDGDPETDADT
ncbi:hypothetical protein RMSM_05750, partial [Rhodopirellula maiorica SM1]